MVVWSLVVLLVLAGVGGGAAWWFSSGPGAYTQVPDGLVEAPRPEAVAILDDAGLSHTVEERYDDAVPEGAVVATDPASGEDVRKDGSVQLVVSKGVRMLTVPTGLVGATQEEATAAIEGADLTLGDPVAEPHDEVPSGQVMAVKDPDGNAIEEGATIRHDVPVVLTVSSGPAPVVVPQVTGSAKDAAVAALEEQGLVPAVTEEYSETVGAGLVIRQDPEQGSDAHRKDTVNVVVSLGPPLVEVPNVSTRNVADAEKALKDAGFQVEIRYPQGIHPLNIVYAQDPPGGRAHRAQGFDDRPQRLLTSRPARTTVARPDHGTGHGPALDGKRPAPAVSAAQHLRDLEGHLQRLLVVEARVDEGLVAQGEPGVVDLLAPAQHLGDVVARELDVQPARHGPRGAVHLEEAAHLVEHVVEPARLVAARRRDGVPVHGVRDPRDGHARARDGLDERRSASRTLPAPMRVTKVRRPSTSSGFRRRASSSATSGVVVGPSLTPTGFATRERKSTCAPSSWRVRSPIHRKWADVSYASPCARPGA